MKRWISCLLAVVMLLALIPVSAQASELGDEWGDFPFIDPTAPTDSSGITASGTCGENLTWTLNEYGYLTISGTGPMDDYAYDEPAPWGSWLDKINYIFIEDGVTTIGDYAFASCRYMSNVIFPDSVTSIGDDAFRECFYLMEVSISENVTSIGKYAFQFCNDLAGIKVAASNPNYSSDSAGALYNKDKTELIRVPGGVSGAFVVPDTVTTISPNALHDCKDITAVELPDSLTTIALSAFLTCNGLTSITIPAGVTSIGEFGFGYCANLTEITFEGNAPSIAADTFSDVTATAYYPANNATWTDAVKQSYGGSITWASYVPPVASGTCGEKLTWTLDSAGTLTISGTGSMEFVNNNCPWYDYRYNINTVVLENGVTSIEDDAFYVCQNMTRVTIPDSVTSIGQSAFRECYSLREVSISRNVTYIGGYAFQFCTGMTSINVASGNPNYSSEAGALYNKNKTELLRVPGGFYGTLVVPNTVTTIAPSAFQSCDGLYEVELPDSITSIPLSTFLFCQNLRKINIPASVTSIDDYAFGGCQNLTEITFEGDVPSIARDAFMSATATAYYPTGNATWTEEVRQNYGGTITWKPYAVTVASGTCGENLTWTLDSAGTLTISGTGAMDNYDSWFNTTPWENHKQSIKNIVIEDGVTTIGDSAFSLCRNLTGVSIPNSVTTVGMLAFSQCSALTGITIPNSVTTICNGAFSGCWSLTGITIPESVTSIAGNPFQSCMGLNGILVDQNNKFYSSDDSGVLFDKEKTTLIAAPGGMSGIYEVPDGVTTIGANAFNSCVSVTDITVPDTVASIGDCAFTGCGSLVGIWVDQNNEFYSNDDRGVLFNKDKATLIAAPGGISGVYTIPSGVTTIAVEAFGSCGSLEGVIISESVTDIGNSAFMYCSSLTNITIPDSVTTIGDNAFFDCSGLTEVKFEGDAPSAGFGVFYGVTATAYYPSGNTTWTEEVRQNYGGTITWVPYTEEVAIPTLMLKYPTLSFESEINYNIYFTVADAEVAVEDLGLLTWYTRPVSTAAATYDTAEYVIPGAVYNSAAGEYMVKSQGIPAMQMGDDLYLRVYAKLADGTYAYSAVTYYSAKDYANTILATSSNDDMKALCVAMLNYGAAAQQHFGHNTNNLMNAGLTEEQKALAKEWSADMMQAVITPDSAKTVNFVSNGGFSSGYPSVSFDGAFAINYFFTAKQTPDTEILLYCWDEETYLAEAVLTEENAVRVLTMKDTGTSGKYMAAYSGIPAKDIGKTLFVAAVYKTGDVRYSSPVVAYSLGTYCQDRIDNGSDTMKALARETAVYGWYAQNYFNA